MARNVSLSMYITLDGFNEFPPYPGSEPRAEEPELVAEEMWTKRWASFDALIFDWRTYQEWAEFWPIENRTAGEHPWFRQMSEFSDRVQKIVLGESPRPTAWARTRFVPGDLGQAIRDLKNETGGTMVVVAPVLGMELIRRGLVDEFLFAVSPVILGKGKRLFEHLDLQQTLRLAEVKSFPAGELFLHYFAAPG